MLFHYVGGGTLMCEIEIEGLTVQMKPRRFDYLCRDGSSPTDTEYYKNSWYGGYRYFVAESMPLRTAQRIVTALGGYLVDDTYIHAGRQLGDGGPFFVHSFDTTCPRYISMYPRFEMALRRAEKSKHVPEYSGVLRIYDSSGYMVMEIKKS